MIEPLLERWLLAENDNDRMVEWLWRLGYPVIPPTRQVRDY